MLFMWSMLALAEPCANGSCPSPHDEPVPVRIKEARVRPAPIDLIAPKNTATAYFALG